MEWKIYLKNQLKILQIDCRNGDNYIINNIEKVINYLENNNKGTFCSFSSKILTDNLNLSSIKLKTFTTDGMEYDFVIDFYKDNLCIYKTTGE